MSTICERCKRPLSDRDSVRLGMGPVCRGKTREGRDGNGGDDGTVADLPFDPDSMDIVCKRVPTGEKDLAGNPMLRTSFNISQTVVQHSPTGFEWGYGGSGPADFALNILNLFVPPDPLCNFDDDDIYKRSPFEPVKCYRGQCSQFAWEHHQHFKGEFVASLPREGGTIHGHEIRKWIRQQELQAKESA